MTVRSPLPGGCGDFLCRMAMFALVPEKAGRSGADGEFYEEGPVKDKGQHPPVLCGRDDDQGGGHVRDRPEPGDRSQQRIKRHVKQATKAQAYDNTRIKMPIVDEADDQERGPYDGAVGDVVMMADLSLIDQIEPEHVQIR